METIDIYVDGSFDKSRATAKWAFIAVKDGKKVFSDSGIITDPEIVEGWQIGGEIQAVIEAIKWSKTNSFKALIAHDYNGLYFWVADSWGEKAWRTNKSYNKKYREFVLSNRNWVQGFRKVDAHTGDFWNEMVDGLAAEAK